MIKIDSDKFNQCDECEKFNVALIEFNQGIYGYSQICQDCLIKAIKTVRPIPENTKYLKYMFNKNAFEEKTMHEFIDWLEPFLEEKEK
jgi:hypothetical protein